MKILDGSLQETVFDVPTAQHKQGEPLSVKKKTLYRKGEVTYISDQIGLHRISNPSEQETAVSLHCGCI